MTGEVTGGMTLPISEAVTEATTGTIKLGGPPATEGMIPATTVSAAMVVGSGGRGKWPSGWKGEVGSASTC